MLRAVREWRGKVYRAGQDDGFFQSDEWLELRRLVFKRDKQTCVRCDKRFKLGDLNAHHLIPRAEGGADDIHNLVTLCEPCHDYVEIQGHLARADIMGSFESDETKFTDETSVQKISPRKETFTRPEWHPYVYGGKRRHTRR